MAQGSVQTAKRTRNAHLTSPKVKVEVTQEIIDSACQRDSSHCMVADAVRAAVPNAQYISVDLATIRFSDLEAGCRYIYLTPRRAQMEILNFDQGETSEPFAITLQGAHIMPTGNGNKGKARLERQNRQSSTRSVPARVDGEAPPLGPLPGGSSENTRGTKNRNGGAGNSTGKRREFGLRAFIR